MIDPNENNPFMLAHLAFKSGHYPDHLRVLQRHQDVDTPRFYARTVDEDATKALLELTIRRGMESGLKPLAALYNIVWFNKRPCVWGDVAKGLIVAHPDCLSLAMDVQGEDKAAIATCTIRRRGRVEGENVTWTATFSWADAARAGLSDLDHYQKYPERMLGWRAFSWAARDAFPDVLNGLSIAEEQKDIEATQGPTQQEQDSDPAQPEIDPFTARAMEASPTDSVDYVQTMAGTANLDQQPATTQNESSTKDESQKEEPQGIKGIQTAKSRKKARNDRAGRSAEAYG